MFKQRNEKISISRPYMINYSIIMTGERERERERESQRERERFVNIFRHRIN